MRSLTAQIRQSKAHPSARTAFGYFNPAGLHVELLVDPKEEEETSKITYLAALMHERCHWLQFVGTPVGLFSAYLGVAQGNALLQDDPHPRALEKTHLPLLDRSTLHPTMRAAWFMAENEAMRITGTDSGYMSLLNSEGPRVTREVLTVSIRKLAELAVGGVPDDWHEFHDGLSVNEGYSDASGRFFSCGVPGVALGGFHLMEAAARQNEVWMLTRLNSRYVVPSQRVWGRPYRIARDVFYELSGVERSSANDAAFCILADWALMCLLPPIAPLSSSEKDAGDLLSPAWLFILLARAYDADVVQGVPDGRPAEFAEELAMALYSDLVPKIGYPDPPTVAAYVYATFRTIADISLADLIKDEKRRSDLSITRLTYLSSLAARATITRVRHPAFFALPIAYYREDKEKFHTLFDPIQPPLWSVPGRRLYPSDESFEWFEYFYLAAVAEDAVAAAAYCDATQVADRLALYSHASAIPSETVDELFQTAVFAVFGQASAANHIIDAWHRQTSG